MNKPISIHATRKFTTEAHDRAMRIGAVALLLLGAFLTFVVVRTSRSGDVRIFGVLMMLAGGGYLLVAALRHASPKPMLELSARGLVYRLIPGRDLIISWTDISGIETLDQGRTRSGDRILKTVLIVPDRVFDASVKPLPGGFQKLFWESSIRRGMGNVRVQVDHTPLSLTFEELRGEIDARWRAFSEHPNATLAPEPWVNETETKRWPRPVKIAIAVVAVATAVPAVYYVNLINLWMLRPEPNDATQTHYFQELITRGGVSARKVGGGMVRVGSLQIVEARYTQCQTEIFRLPQPQAWLPRYDSTSTCTTDLRLRSGEGAIAIWKIYTQTGTRRRHNDTVEEFRYRAAGTFDPAEGEARLCQMGRC